MKKLVLAVFLTCAFSSNLFADLLGDSVNVFFDTPGPGDSILWNDDGKSGRGILDWPRFLFHAAWQRPI